MKTKILLALLICYSGTFPALQASDKLADQFPLTSDLKSLDWIKTFLRGRYNLDQMGGLARLMDVAGPETAMPLLANTLNKSRVLQLSEISYLIGTSTQCVDHIRALLANKSSRTLGASSLAAMAVSGYIYAEKIRVCGKVPLKADDTDKKGKDDKKKEDTKTTAKDQTEKFSKEIGELLSEKNDTLVEYGLIAAAYAADKTNAETVNKIKAKSGGIPGLKLLYAVRCGLPIDKELVSAAFAKSTCRAETIDRESALLSLCQTLVPSTCSAAEAIGLLEEKGSPYLADVHKTLLEDKDIRSQVAAAIAIGRVRSEESVPILLQAMEKCKWPVLVHVLDALGRIPSATSVEKLIERLDKEKGRFRKDCLYALNSIAGERLLYNTAEEFTTWWEQTKPTYAADRTKTDAFRAKHRINDMSVPSLSGFYGLGIYSDHVALVLDSSPSMAGEKIESLREKTIDALTPLMKLGFVRANVIDFGGVIKIYYPDSLTNDIRGMIAYVTKGLELSSGTRSMDALIGGLRIHDVDTICFLSDGAPVVSIREDWERIGRYIAMMNRFRPVAIYCIAFKAEKDDYNGMAQLSWEHVGESEKIE